MASGAQREEWLIQGHRANEQNSQLQDCLLAFLFCYQLLHTRPPLAAHCPKVWGLLKVRTCISVSRNVYDAGPASVVVILLISFLPHHGLMLGRSSCQVRLVTWIWQHSHRFITYGMKRDPRSHVCLSLQYQIAIKMFKRLLLLSAIISSQIGDKQLARWNHTWGSICSASIVSFYLHLIPMK